MTNIILTAVITFVISGIGGMMFEQWLNKAKPSLAIKDIIFGHPNQYIEIEKHISGLIQSIPWDLGLRENLLTTDEISKSYSFIRNLISDLKEATNACEQWMETHYHEPKKIKRTPDLYINDVKSHPFFKYSVIGKSLTGDIARSAIETPPKGLDKIRSGSSDDSERMFDLYQEEVEHLFKYDRNHESIILDSGLRNYTKKIDDNSISNLVLTASGFTYIFERSRIRNEDLRCICTLLAESFSLCVDENIFHYTREFINHSNNEISRLEQVADGLFQILENRLTIYMELSAYNFGKTATAIDSYMGLKIFNRTKGNNLLIFKAIQIKSINLVSSNSEDQSSQNRYISLEPQSSYKITIELDNSVSLDEIKELREIYRTGLLTCRLLAKTNDRRKVLTETVGFGRKNDGELHNHLRKDLLHLRYQSRVGAIVNLVVDLLHL